MSIRGVYSSYSDSELVERYRRGDADAGEVLASRYAGLVRALASQMKIPGTEVGDREQIGWIGFWKAVERYEASGGHGKLSTLAYTCIRRHLISALVWENREKRKLLNATVSLDAPRYEEGDDEIDFLADGLDLERELCEREYVRQFLAELRRRVKPFEWTVFIGVLAGQSEEEIARRYRRSPLGVHSALWRARRIAQDLMREMEGGEDGSGR